MEQINGYYQQRLKESLTSLHRIISEAKFKNYNNDTDIQKEWQDLYKKSQILIKEYNSMNSLEKTFVEDFCSNALGLHYKELELNVISECGNAGWYGCY